MTDKCINCGHVFEEQEARLSNAANLDQVCVSGPDCQMRLKLRQAKCLACGQDTAPPDCPLHKKDEVIKVLKERITDLDSGESLVRIKLEQLEVVHANTCQEAALRIKELEACLKGAREEYNKRDKQSHTEIKRLKRHSELINGALLAAGVQVTQSADNDIRVVLSLPKLARRKPNTKWPGTLRQGYGPVNEDPLIGPDIKPHAKMDRAQLLDEVKRLEALGRPSAELRDLQVQVNRYREQAKGLDKVPVASRWKAAALAQEISITRILNAKTMLECHMALVELDKATKLMKLARAAASQPKAPAPLHEPPKVYMAPGTPHVTNPKYECLSPDKCGDDFECANYYCNKKGAR